MSGSYTPLFDPEGGVGPTVLALPEAIDRARRVLDEKATANIHSKDEMIAAATGLDYVLRGLLAALDAEAAS